MKSVLKRKNIPHCIHIQISSFSGIEMWAAVQSLKKLLLSWKSKWWLTDSKSVISVSLSPSVLVATALSRILLLCNHWNKAQGFLPSFLGQDTFASVFPRSHKQWSICMWTKTSPHRECNPDIQEAGSSSQFFAISLPSSPCWLCLHPFQHVY